MRPFQRTTPATVAVPFCAPDGLCLDEEGGRWVADSINKRMFRVHDGVITEEYYLDQYVLACVLGDRDRRSLYVCVTDAWHKSDTREEPTGRILRLRVAIPGVGRPSDHVRQPEPGTTMTEAGRPGRRCGPCWIGCAPPSVPSCRTRKWPRPVPRAVGVRPRRA